MEYLSQYDFFKHYLTSASARNINDREATYVLMLIYAMFHGLEIRRTEYDSLSIIPDSNDILAQELAALFIDKRVFRLLPFEDILSAQLTCERMGREQYEELVDLVLSLIETIPYVASSMYPKEISELFGCIIKSHKCKRIYNPFAGMASIAIALGGYAEKYVGQDFNTTNRIIALIRLDSKCLRDNCDYTIGDSITEWSPKGADVITAMMPWGVRVSNSHIPKEYRDFHSISIEDLYYLHSCLHSPEAELVLGCSSISFCSSPRSLDIRKWLCQERIVESVIKLPAVLRNTNMSPYVVVLTPKEKHNTIRFVNAAEDVFESAQQESCINTMEVMANLNSSHGHHTYIVSYEQIIKDGYYFNPEFYDHYEENLKPNEKRVRLCDHVIMDDGERCLDNETLIMLTSKNFSSDFYDICKTEVTNEVSIDNHRRGYYKFTGPCIVVNKNSSSKLRLYWHRSGTTIAGTNCFAMRVASNAITYEYLMYTLLNNRSLNEFIASNLYRIVRPSDISNFQIIIEGDLQKQTDIVNSVIEAEFRERKASFEADKKRLNIRKAGSDLMHILGTPFSLQDKMIMRLNQYSGDKNNPEYVERVNALISISSYINRICHAMNTDFADASYYKRDVDLAELIRSYIHQMTICDALEYPIDWIDIKEKVLVKADETMIQILMDCIMENAWRHGFKKQISPNDRIGIIIGKVVYNEQPFALLSICNNGKPLPSDITIKDYISKGRFSEESGRTGLGGYHVYSIVKKHDGFMAIRSDKQWNFIIDILLPLNDSNMDYIYSQYGYDTL